MVKKTLDRRTVLKGVLATGATVSIPLPLMEIMLNGNGTAYAQTATPVPPLFVLWFFGNGSLPGVVEAGEHGDRLELGSQLAAAAAVGPEVVLDGHQRAHEPAGRGRRRAPDGLGRRHHGRAAERQRRDGASINQVVANIIGTGAPFKSSRSASRPRRRTARRTRWPRCRTRVRTRRTFRTTIRSRSSPGSSWGRDRPTRAPAAAVAWAATAA